MVYCTLDPVARGADATSTDDVTARNDLVLSYEGLARSVARRFANRGETLEDLVQVAMLGLVKAADRFDTAHNTQFSTYATATITGELKRHFRDKRWGLHVPRSAQERYLLIRDATEWARADVGRSPTIGEIASRAGVKEEDVLEAQCLSGAFHLNSIDALDADGSEPIQVGSLDPHLETIDGSMSLKALLRELPRRDQQIIALRFVDEMTQSQIAERLEISQMQVSRLLSRILWKLRESLAATEHEQQTQTVPS